MKARRSPWPSSDQRARKFASEPPFIIVTFSAVAPGYHSAIAARDACEPSDKRIAELGVQEGLAVRGGSEQIADRHGEHAGFRQVVIDEVPVLRLVALHLEQGDLRHGANASRSRTA